MVCSIASNSLCLRASDARPHEFGCENLRLSILLYVSLVLLPDEQIRCDKAIWATWIEIGRVFIDLQMAVLDKSFTFLSDILYITRLLPLFTL